MTAQAAAGVRPTGNDTPKILAALKDGKTIQWCTDAYGWPRARIKALADDQPGWLVDTTRDTVRIFTRVEDTMTQPDQPTTGLETLLRRGEASESAYTRAAAQRTRDAVEDLRQRIEAEAAEKQVRDRIATLKQQLDAANEQLRDLKPKKKTATPRPATPAGVSSKDVRAWARKNNIACSPNGRIPQHIVDQYQTATAAS